MPQVPGPVSGAGVQPGVHLRIVLVDIFKNTPSMFYAGHWGKITTLALALETQSEHLCSDDSNLTSMLCYLMVYYAMLCADLLCVVMCWEVLSC